MASPDSIKGFYAGQTVLVTGGSGFVGKVIIEKILRSCPDVRMVYTLLRSKKGVSVADRLQKIKQAAVGYNFFRVLAIRLCLVFEITR